MESDENIVPKGRPVILGEVLFDHFPDGSRVLGGAPFNVAWHLCGFGLEPLFISRVGVDTEGGSVLSRMEEWAMDRTGIQLDRRHPTGEVRVSLDARHHPTYEILEARAWDFVDAGEAARALNRRNGLGLISHGTLALRSDVSRRALRSILETSSVPVLVDVNLREPWWTRDLLDEVMAGARWAKMNDEEVRTLTGRDDPVEGARDLRERHGLDALVVTKGDSGAFFLSATDFIRQDAEAVADVVDTVGAGDAFTAVTIVGLMRSWRMQTTLDRASRFAAEICRRRGATQNDRELYRETLADWSQAP